MAKESLLALVCTSAFLTTQAASQTLPAPADDPDKAVATRLAVQNALVKAKEHLLRAEYGAAVDVLESQLVNIDGNRAYLNQLKEAYRGYIKELRLNKLDTEAKRYLNRLVLLDRGAILDSALTGATPNSGETNTPARPVSQPVKAVPNPTNKTAPTVRLKGSEELAQSARLTEPLTKDSKSILAKAEQEFAAKHYRTARLLYEDAYQADPSIAKTCGERWAYCKLFYVVEQLNQATGANAPSPELEQEVRLALGLAPRLSDAKEIKAILGELQKRRGGLPPAEVKNDNDLQVRDLGRNAEGWNIGETANFRIYHQSPELAAQVARVAENTRATMQQKWFGAGCDPWNPKCEIYLHPTADAYGRATGQYNSPGHSSLRLENGRLVTRRIDLHCDESTMLSAVLPHEATHVVLAGQFGGQLLPRWADEGMAVLSEPQEKVDRHLTNLNRCRQEGQLLRLQELMQLEDYPRNPRVIGAFYAQSVSLVEYLTSLRGPQAFTMFMLEGMRYGYEKALQRTYNIQSFTVLEERWSQLAFRERAGQNGVAAR
jgi:hypothetical protein